MFSFNEMNLTNNEISTGGFLKKGRYVAEVSEAAVKDNKSKDGKLLELKFTDTHGAGSIRYWLNLTNKNPDAQRIGRNELKTLLFFGGHPNPNQPGDVALIKKLKVGIVVDESPYKDNFGNEKTRSEVVAIIDPHEIEPEKYQKRVVPPKAAANQQQQAATAAAAVNADDVPF